MASPWCSLPASSFRMIENGLTKISKIWDTVFTRTKVRAKAWQSSCPSHGHGREKKDRIILHQGLRWWSLSAGTGNTAEFGAAILCYWSYCRHSCGLASSSKTQLPALSNDYCLGYWAVYDGLFTLSCKQGFSCLTCLLFMDIKLDIWGGENPDGNS